jgi:hypothetical protein
VVERFEGHPDLFDPAAIRSHAVRFSNERLLREFRAFVDARHAEHLAMIEDAKGVYDPHGDNQPAALTAVA